MKLSILIVNYNGERYLGDCLRSIQENVTVDHEVIIVDNASTDGSCTYVKQAFPGVTLIISEKNLGFAGGNNLGASKAKGEYLLLLNNDTVLLNPLNPAIELLENDPAIGIASAMMLNGDKEYSRSAGNFPTPLRLARIASVYKNSGCFKYGNFPQQDQELGYIVDWAAGSFLLLRLSLWNKLGGLDEGYFMYGEDIDLCRRALDAGLLTVYCPGVSYVHYCGFDPSRFPLIIKGFRRYNKKFLNVFSDTLSSGIIFWGLIARVIVYGLLFVMCRKSEYRAKTRACLASLNT